MSRITSEAKMWKHLRTKLLYTGCLGHFTRIESGATVLGQPDVNYCIKGCEGNLELKFAKKENDMLILRPSQYQWMNQRIMCGAKNVWILAHISETKTWMLIHGRHARNLITKPREWECFTTKIWKGSINTLELTQLIGNKDGKH